MPSKRQQQVLPAGCPGVLMYKSHAWWANILQPLNTLCRIKSK